MRLGDFRVPQPEDRLIALLAAIDARGESMPRPPICHGYANGCECPPCKLRHRKPARSRLAA